MKLKTIISTAISFLPMVALPARILWAGMDGNAVVDIGGNRIHVADWFSTLPCSPVDIGGRIRIGDRAMPAGYEYPIGMQPPAVSFDDDITEFGLLVLDGNDEPTGQLADWQPIRLDIADQGSTVYFDIGYWDEDAGWSFVPVAYASASLGDLWSPHTYESGTLLPPTETPWRPSVFYGAIPEPNVACLALVGAVILWLCRRRRK